MSVFAFVVVFLFGAISGAIACALLEAVSMAVNESKKRKLVVRLTHKL